MASQHPHKPARTLRSSGLTLSCAVALLIGPAASAGPSGPFNGKHVLGRGSHSRFCKVDLHPLSVAAPFERHLASGLKNRHFPYERPTQQMR